MGQIRHRSATTTHAIRAAIQRSHASAAEPSRTYGIIPKTVLKWRKRTSIEDRKTVIKKTTVKRFHHESHDRLRRHLGDFLDAYNFARRLKALAGLTPYEFICKAWTSEPDRFILDPIHQMPGLNT